MKITKQQAAERIIETKGFTEPKGFRCYQCPFFEMECTGEKVTSRLECIQFAAKWLKNNREKETKNTNLTKALKPIIEMLEEEGIPIIEVITELSKSKPEKQLEKWPSVDKTVFTIDILGDIICYDFNGNKEVFEKFIRNNVVFETYEIAEKYYSIIDTINEIVDELGRPTWEDHLGKGEFSHSIIFDTLLMKFFDYNNEITVLSFGIFPYCKKPYLEKLLKEVSEEDLLEAFKYSMGFRV